MAIFNDIADGSSLIVQPVNERFNLLKSDLKGIMLENIGYGIRTGLEVVPRVPADMYVTISGGVGYLPDGTRVSITQTDKLISNPSVQQHTNEQHTTTASGTFYTDLKPITDGDGNYATALDVSVRKVSDGTSVNVINIDYSTGLIETDLATATDIYIDYYHGQQRIDVISINTSGVLTVTEGTPADSNPKVPNISSSHLKLAEISVLPKSAIMIEQSDIVNLEIKKGLWADDNFNIIVGGDLTVLGNQVTGEVVNDTIIVRTNLYNDQPDQPLYIGDDLNVSGNITLGGTVDGRDIAYDGTVLDSHITKQVDPVSTDTVRDKHVSNNDIKTLLDHVNYSGNIHLVSHNELLNIGEVDVASTDTTKDKHVSNALAKTWNDHLTDTNIHISLGETSSTAYRGDRGKLAYEHSITQGNVHNMDHADLNAILGANTSSSDTVKNKHVSNAQAKNWEDHRLAGSPHADHVKGSIRLSVGTTAPTSPTMYDLWIDMSS